MGFFLRKGFKIGPLRLNLSKSGIGAPFALRTSLRCTYR
jgi:Protein of unknown function (DUF4236)